MDWLLYYNERFFKYNDRSVCSNKKSRGVGIIYAGNKAIRYFYIATYPHVGTGKKVQFKDMGEVGITLWHIKK